MNKVLLKIKQGWFWIQTHVPLPYLYLVLDLGIISLRTTLMYRVYETMYYEYVGMSWKVLKWRGEFALYTPFRRRMIINN